MRKKSKDPSLLGQIIEIYHEQAKTRKALRNLEKQRWSVEFLQYLILNAAKKSGKDLEMTITSPDRASITIRSTAVTGNKLSGEEDSDILNKLDDTVAVNEFIRKHSR